jgi:CBS-domain-containing membrane protein
MLGHGIAIVCGVVATTILQIRGCPFEGFDSLSFSRMAAIALALGLTCASNFMARIIHPPAGATTVIVSMGLSVEPLQLGAMWCGAILLPPFVAAVQMLRNRFEAV